VLSANEASTQKADANFNHQGIQKMMKTKTLFFLTVFLIALLLFSAGAVNPNSLEKSGAGSIKNCQSVDLPSFAFNESNTFPKDKSLRHPEDGKALADGRIVVGDEKFGLRIIEKDGKSRPFGKFKQIGWTHNPPQSPAGPNGMFLESDGFHLLLADVYTGKIYRVDTKTEETKMIYDHPFGVNSLVRDTKGTIWFTQSAKNTEEKGAEEMWNAVNQPASSGAVFYLRGLGDEVRAPAVESAGNLYFANGIAIDKAEKYLYVAETMMDRILRFELNVASPLSQGAKHTNTSSRPTTSRLIKTTISGSPHPSAIRFLPLTGVAAVFTRCFPRHPKATPKFWMNGQNEVVLANRCSNS